MRTNVFALQIAESIDIGACKDHFQQTLLRSDKNELFFDFENQKYAYIFKYGIICVFNFASNEIDRLRQQLFEFTTNPKLIDNSLTESLDIIIDAKSFSMNYYGIHIMYNDIQKIRLVMLNVSQSLLLDHSIGIAEQLIEETKRHTVFLEAKKRKLYTDEKKHKHYLAKVLNSKNKISKNLYLFNSPDSFSDDDIFNKLNIKLKKILNVKNKHKTISEQLNIIEENLEFFNSIMVSRNSNKLKWIIIVLMIIGVIGVLLNQS